MSEVFLNTGPDGTPVQLSEFVPSAIFSSALQTGTLQASTVQADSATITSAILQSGIVTGSPLEPGSASIASTKYVDDRIQAVVGASPAALDSLAELAAALGNDSDFAATITSQLASKAALASSNVFEGNGRKTYSYIDFDPRPKALQRAHVMGGSYAGGSFKPVGGSFYPIG